MEWETFLREYSRPPATNNAPPPHIPRVRRTRGRPTVWKPCLVEDEDYRAIERLKQKYGPRTSTVTRVRDSYRQFCQTNGFTSAQGFEPWLGSLIRHKLAPGTIETYMTYVMRQALSNAERLAVMPAIRAVQVAHADEDTITAPVLPMETLLAIAKRAKRARDYVALRLLMLTGLRLSDLTWLRRRQVIWDTAGEGPHTLGVQVRVAKNRKARQRRATIYPEWNWAGGVDQDLISFLNSLPPDKRILSKADAGRIMSWLRSMVKAKTVPHVTSFSFRKHYIIGVTNRFPETEWTRWTLHLSPNIVKAHYLPFQQGSEVEEDGQL